jgi:hypothetical protein
MKNKIVKGVGNYGHTGLFTYSCSFKFKKKIINAPNMSMKTEIILVGNADIGGKILLGQAVRQTGF